MILIIGAPLIILYYAVAGLIMLLVMVGYAAWWSLVFTLAFVLACYRLIAAFIRAMLHREEPS